MNSDVLKYLGFVGLLVFVYLVITGGGGKNPSGASNVINAISNGNASMIKALQGR